MDKAERERLRKLISDAFPPIWEYEEAPLGGFNIVGSARDGHPIVIAGRGQWSHRAKESAASGRLIAAARTALPQALDALAAAEERARGLRSALHAMVAQHDGGSLLTEAHWAAARAALSPDAEREKTNG